MPSAEAVEKFEDSSIGFLHLDENTRYDYVYANLVRWESKIEDDGIISIPEITTTKWSIYITEDNTIKLDIQEKEVK